jgi:hypothetical protein
VGAAGGGAAPPDPPRRPARHSGPGPAARDFARRYGWRAYALPVLMVFTVFALMTAKTQPQPRILADRTAHHPGASHAASSQPASSSPAAPAAAQTARPSASSRSSATVAAPTPRPSNSALPRSALLPHGPAFSRQGTGTFQVVKGSGPVVGGSGPSVRLFRYDVETEKGITGIDAASFAASVQRVLSDSRSWAGHRWQGTTVALQRVDRGPVSFHVSLTTPLTTRQYCGYEVKVETSCYVSAGDAPGVDVNRVVLNLSRWVRGAAAYPGDVATYRTYMINHEDGHALGHDHAHQCLPNGMAPVMMQQTIGLRSALTHQTCTANPWPYPRGVRGVPGAEQQDTSQNSEIALNND